MNWDHVAESLLRSGRKWVAESDHARGSDRQRAIALEATGLTCIALAGALANGLGKPTLPGDKK
jgi:hypothetical protein